MLNSLVVLMSYCNKPVIGILGSVSIDISMK